MGFYGHGFNWAHTGGRGMGWHGMGWGGMGIFAWVLGLVFFLGLLALLALVAVWAFRQFGQEGAPVKSSAAVGDPLDVARQRLAAGEITLEEYEEIRERLRR